MSSTWPMVPLGEVMAHRKEFIQINDLEPYKRCRVQLHAQGIVLRDQVPGAEIKTKKQQVCRAGEFLVAEIDAKLGGYGIVPAELEGAIVSSHYFLFGVDESKLDRSFLGYFIKTPSFFEQVAAQGSTNYAAIRPGHVLEYTIPFPPLAEQRRLVERIDALATKIEEAKRLREEGDERRILLWLSALETAFRELDQHVQPLGKVLTRVKRERILEPGKDYLPAGLTNQAKGIIEYPAITSSQTKYQSLFAIEGGDLLYSKLKVWEGSLAIVGQENSGRVVSSEFPMFRVDYSQVTKEFLDLWLRRPSLWTWLGDQVRGIGGRKIRVDEQTFLRAPLPLPPVSVQIGVSERLRRFQQTTSEVKALQRHSSGELDAMLPAILDRAFRGEL